MAAAGRKRLLFVQLSLQPPGGANGVSAWILQALRREYRLALLTWHAVDLEAVNRYYGTSLEPGDLQQVPVPRAARAMALLPVPSWLLKSALLVRRGRAIAHRYEALVSVDNEADFGTPGIQYIHYPRQLLPRPAADLRWYHSPALLRCYYAAAKHISGGSADGVRRNLTLVNSDWTGELVRRLYPGISTRTVPPPVAGHFPLIPWEHREDGIVVVGRIAAAKRVDIAIEITRRLRERGRRLRLHVIGSADDRASYAVVEALAREHREWLTLHQNLTREDLCALLSRQRYGLHAMEDEHYGVAVAEMVAAGLIPFVPDSGGQREIVDGVPEVLWRTPEAAVERMIAVLDDPQRQLRILATLAPRRRALGSDRFMERVREEVVSFLSPDGALQAPSRAPCDEDGG